MKSAIQSLVLVFGVVLLAGCAEQQFTVINGCELKPGGSCAGADLRGVELSGLDLSDINLAGADLRDVTFTQVNLSGANMSSTRLEGIGWNRTICPDGSKSQDNGATCGGHLQDHVLVCKTSPGVDCSELVLSGEDLRFANLRNASLAGTSLDDADLTGASLGGADLTCADLSSARVGSVNWEGARCPDGELSSRSEGTCEGFTDPETASLTLFFSCSSEEQ